MDEIDAAGLYVLPGFIDTHVHSDMALLHDRQHANGWRRGLPQKFWDRMGYPMPLFRRRTGGSTLCITVV